MESSNEIKIYLNNKQLNFDTYPITEKDRTLVPMRAIFEALGEQKQNGKMKRKRQQQQRME